MRNLVRYRGIADIDQTEPIKLDLSVRALDQERETGCEKQISYILGMVRQAHRTANQRCLWPLTR
jgi:hypothetical protein